MPTGVWPEVEERRQRLRAFPHGLASFVKYWGSSTSISATLIGEIPCPANQAQRFASRKMPQGVVGQRGLLHRARREESATAAARLC